MIYIAFALFVEAKAFIKKYSLIKDASFTKAQVFKNDAVTVIITGAGIGTSEISLTYALALLNPQEGDIFANYGICGGLAEDIGKTYIINSLYDTVNERNYYTDILYCHNFEEKALSTYSKPVKKPKGLCDTESAFLYRAAQLFFPQHRIFIFKTVSDSGNDISKEYIEKIIHMNEIYDFLLSLPSEGSAVLDREEAVSFENFCKKGRFTEAMKSKLKQILIYKKLSENFNIKNFFGENIVYDKEGGKKLIESLSENL